MVVEYCTLDDVRRALDLRSTQPDTWLQSLIPMAREVIDRYIGYSFQDEPVTTKLFSGRSSDVLLTGNIRSITQVIEIIGVGMFAAGERDITADCVLWPENELPAFGLMRLSCQPFEEGRRNYRVTGDFGFGTVPYAITRACTRLIVHWYKMRDTAYADTVSEQGSIRQKYSKEMPVDVLEILNMYRLKGFYSR